MLKDVKISLGNAKVKDNTSENEQKTYLIKGVFILC